MQHSEMFIILAVVCIAVAAFALIFAFVAMASIDSKYLELKTEIQLHLEPLETLSLECPEKERVSRLYEFIREHTKHNSARIGRLELLTKPSDLIPVTKSEIEDVTKVSKALCKALNLCILEYPEYVEAVACSDSKHEIESKHARRIM